MTATEFIIDKFLNKHLVKGRLSVTYPSGITRRYGEKVGKGEVSIKVSRLPFTEMRNPSVFFGESYMAGDVQIAEDQLDDFFKLLSLNETSSPLVNAAQKSSKRNKNKRSKQRKYISHHYDIGNEYYKLWLDKSMTYSCAYFLKESDSLEKAQLQKIDHLLRKLRLEAGQHLLDIGSGWGYLSVAAARQYGVRVTGITLSEEQLAGAQELAKQSGVNDLVEFKLANYQDLPGGKLYDRIISVGMYEHVGRGNHAAYFRKVKELLTDDGVSVLHTITQRNDKPVSPWVDKYIFPGGHLPTVSSIEAHLENYGFFSIDRENLWQHYAMTLDIWRQRHQAHRKEITAMFDEKFYRMQDFWLAGSAATFRYSGTAINQIIFTKNKPEFKSWPLTREYLTPSKTGSALHGSNKTK